MRIVCPACTAAYDVPETRLAAGRTVRCARCGTDWMPLVAEAPLFQMPDEDMLDDNMLDGDMLDEPPADAPVSFPPPAMKTGPRLDTAVLAGWAISLALLAALGWGGIAWRTNVMHAWPPSERLYAALGLVSDPAGQ